MLARQQPNPVYLLGIGSFGTNSARSIGISNTLDRVEAFCGSPPAPSVGLGGTQPGLFPHRRVFVHIPHVLPHRSCGKTASIGRRTLKVLNIKSEIAIVALKNDALTGDESDCVHSLESSTI